MMDDAPDVPRDVDVSPLRTFLVEAHEVYIELIDVGFPEKAAAIIVAVMIADAIDSREDGGEETEVLFDIADDDDEDDLDDDDDFGRTG